ncbi:unnamed protein product [Boreogadus saida]
MGKGYNTTDNRGHQPNMKSIQCPATVLLLATILLLASQTTSSLSMDRMQKQRTPATGSMSQEWNKRALEDLLTQLTLPEGDSQQEAEVVSMVTGGTGTELERSVDNTPETLQRGRKAGCKNFYWKGFTVC